VRVGRLSAGRLSAGRTEECCRGSVLRAELPHLLWLYHMGVLMFWVHDGSPDAMRTRELVDRTVPVIDRLIKLARVPGLGPVAHQLVAIARDLRQFAVRDA